MGKTWWPLALLIAAVSAACAGTPPPPKPPPRPTLRKPAPHFASADGSYWSPVDPELPEEAPLGAPLDRESLAKALGTFGSIPSESASQLREDGIARTRGGARSMPTWHTRKQGAATLITADTLFFVARNATAHALAALNDEVTRPAMTRVTKGLAEVLAKEAPRVGSDLQSAYALARGVVWVATVLANPNVSVPPELAPTVGREVQAVREHQGLLVSPLFGVPLDYAEFSPSGDVEGSAEDVGERTAFLYLSRASFSLLARNEGGAPKVLPQTARTHTRAALVLARAADEHVNASLGKDYDAIAHLLRFAFGATDDASLDDVMRIASSLGFPPEDPLTAANVIAVDKIRKVTAIGERPRVFDGAGGRPIQTKAREEGSFVALPTVRVLGSSTSGDGTLLQALVFPSVGLHPERGQRRLPSGLDVGAWFGSEEAMARLKKRGALAHEGLELALLREKKRREADSVAHASAYATWIDAVATYASPSIGDDRIPATKSPNWPKQKLETVLSAWVEGRHDATPTGRKGPPLVIPASDTSVKDAKDVKHTVRVEPHPEAIAKLVGYVRQVSKGLGALGAKPSPELEAADTWLTAALHAAEREARGEVPTLGDQVLLLGLVDALAKVGEKNPAADDAAMIRVHTDLGKGEALVAGTGPTDTVYLVLRDGDADILVAAGPSRSFYEWVQPAAATADDASWRARLVSAPPKPNLESDD